MAGNIGILDNQVEVLVLDHAPSGLDYADPGDVCVDLTGRDAYIACGTSAGLQVWIPVGGGSGAFNSLTVNPGNMTVTAGNFEVTAGTVTIGAFGRGLVFSSAAGLLSASSGTNGQVVLGATGASPAWGNITSSDGSLVVTVGANTLDLSVSGATVSSFPTDAGTANPVLGATTIAGGTNINTSAAGGTVTVNLDNSPSVSGSLTAGTSVAAGTTVTAGTNVIATAGSVTANVSVVAVTGNITANAGNIAATLGSVTAGTTVTAGTSVSATTTVTAGTNITSTAGDVIISAANKGVILPGGLKIVVYNGDPNGHVTAPIGSLCLNSAGSGVADRLWLNTDAGTTWTNVTTAA